VSTNPEHEAIERVMHTTQLALDSSEATLKLETKDIFLILMLANQMAHSIQRSKDMVERLREAGLGSLADQLLTAIEGAD
jgi:hypothetical protein